MKGRSLRAFVLMVVAGVVHASAGAGGPMSKVFEMLADLQAKLLREGEEAQKVYDEFSAWCQDRSKNIGFEIKGGKAQVAELSAIIEKETAKMVAFNTRIEELSGSIASDEANLKKAAEIRASEKADFTAEETESQEVIGILERAIAVLSREAAKGSASMLQVKGAKGLAEAMDAMVNASAMTSADASRLSALVQNSEESQEGDSDSEQGAPDPAAYKGASGSVIDTLENLLETAQVQLDKARKTEATNAHNFAMLKQSLTDEIEAGSKDLAETKQSLAVSGQSKAAAEGDLATTKADLKEDVTTNDALHQDCSSGAQDFESETRSRSDELKAVADAKKALAGALPAAAQTYGAALDQATFLQVASSDDLASHGSSVQFEAIKFIRDLARQQNSVALAQLASKMSSIVRYGSSAGIDPFAKIKAMISDLVKKLEKDAAADASHKGFCDKETSETQMKKDEKKYQIDKLSTKIDSMSANAAKLKEESATLQKELVELATSQAEMERIRTEEKALYGRNKAEMQAGIQGVQKALSILREYYAQDGSEQNKGAGSGIVGMLEVVESDFTKGLAEMEVVESTAVKEYEETSYMNKVARASKDKDLEYKVKEAAALAKGAAESSSDKDGAQAELDALLEYLAKLDKMCIAKAEPYERQKERRQAEIAGLRQALAMLEGEAVLLEQTSRRNFRGKRTWT